METTRDQNKFSSSISTYLTLLGYSIGASDIWRFPLLVNRHGGGAFLIPFIIMIIVCGIPMYFLEYSIAKFSGRGPYQLWDICPLFRGIGVTVSVSYAVYIIGSSVFRCWIIEFLVFTFRDPIPWSHCHNNWNTPYCKGNEALVGDTTDNLLSGSVSNNNGYDNTTSAHAYIIDNVTVGANMTVPGTPMSAAEEFWQYQVLQLSSGMWDLSPVIWRYFLYLFIYRVAILLCSIKSIKSIEKVIYVTATVPFIMTVAIFIRSLMLPGAIDGIHYFFNPDFNKLLDARIWIEATLMSFYTLAFGWGTIVVLGSHAAFNDNCLRTSIMIPIIDALVAIFSGMVCFSVLGNMAHTYDVHVTEVVNAGLATGMVAYVTALTSLPVPQLWMGLFLISTLLTGVDSQMIPLEMIMQMIMQLLGDLFPRVKVGFRIYALVGVSLVMFLLSLFLCTGAGAYIFLWNDWYGAAWAGPIVALVEVIVVAWIYGMDRFNEDVYLMIGREIPGILRIGIAFVAPITVTVIFCTSIAEYLPPKYGSYSYPSLARVIGWCVVIVVIMPIFVQAVYTLTKSKGAFVKKLRHYMRPLDTWGPCDEDAEDVYHERKRKFNRRSVKDLLYYNFLGTYPSTSHITGKTKHELDVLTNSEK